MSKKNLCWLWERWCYAPRALQKQRAREEPAAFWVAGYLKHPPKKEILTIFRHCMASLLQNVMNTYINFIFIALNKKIVVCLRTKEILTFHLLLISSVLLPRFFKTVARSPQIFSSCSEKFWTWLSSLLCHGGADFPASPLSLRNKTYFLLFPVYLSLRTFLQQVLFVCDMTLWGVL